MNGEKLPPDHGAPLRVIVPGANGARHVKWVSEIEIVREHDVQSPWWRRYYKVRRAEQRRYRKAAAVGTGDQETRKAHLQHSRSQPSRTEQGSRSSSGRYRA